MTRILSKEDFNSLSNDGEANIKFHSSAVPSNKKTDGTFKSMPCKHQTFCLMSTAFALQSLQPTNKMKYLKQSQNVDNVSFAVSKSIFCGRNNNFPRLLANFTSGENHKISTDRK